MGVRPAASVVQLIMNASRLARRILLSLAGIAIALFAYGLTAPIEIHQNTSDGSTATLAGGSSTSQTFTAHFPGLDQITVECDRATDPSQLGFALRGQNGQLVSSQDAHWDVTGNLLTIQFPQPQYDVPAHLTFTLSNTSSDPIKLAADFRDMYPEGQRVDAPGDLVFRATFRPGPAQTVSILLGRLAHLKPGAAGNRGTYIILFAGLAASFLAFSCSFIHATQPSDKSHLES